MCALQVTLAIGEEANCSSYFNSDSIQNKVILNIILNMYSISITVLLACETPQYPTNLSKCTFNWGKFRLFFLCSLVFSSV